MQLCARGDDDDAVGQPRWRLFITKKNETDKTRNLAAKFGQRHRHRRGGSEREQCYQQINFCGKLWLTTWRNDVCFYYYYLYY